MVETQPSDLRVRIITSPRRKKTVSARIVDDTIEIRMPEGLSTTERDRHVANLTAKLLKKRQSESVDLEARARRLATMYDLPVPKRIEWSSRQHSRWGSCTPATSSIRISQRMASFPTWVIDSVIVHELAHLVEPNHSPRFHELANRYPVVERAEGFLLAVSLGHAGSLDENPTLGDCTA